MAREDGGARGLVDHRPHERPVRGQLHGRAHDRARRDRDSRDGRGLGALLVDGDHGAVDRVAHVQVAGRDAGQIGQVRRPELTHRPEQRQRRGRVPPGQREVDQRAARRARPGRQRQQRGQRCDVAYDPARHDDAHRELAADVRELDPLPVRGVVVRRRRETLVHQRRRDAPVRRRERAVGRARGVELRGPGGLEVDGVGEHQDRAGVEPVEQPVDAAARLVLDPAVDRRGGARVRERDGRRLGAVLRGEQPQEALVHGGYGPAVQEQAVRDGDDRVGWDLGRGARRRPARHRVGRHEVRGQRVERPMRGAGRVAAGRPSEQLVELGRRPTASTRAQHPERHRDRHR